MVAIDHLYKYYGKFPALIDINLKVEKGIIFGLVGPNGSGKTTLIRAMVGTLKPSSGRVNVMGMDPIRHRKAISRRIGYMPQEFALYEDLTVEENVKFFARLMGVGDVGRIREVLDFVEIGDRSDSPVYALSGGLKRRVSFAISILHDPYMLILDEPTAALDPYLRKKFWESFRRLKREGKTIIVSTHLVDEISKCDIVGILFRGRLVMVDSPDRIFRYGNIQLEILLKERKVIANLPNRPQEIAAYLRKFGLGEEVEGIHLGITDPDDILISIFKKQEESDG